jgi:hypothetical protein
MINGELLVPEFLTWVIRYECNALLATGAKPKSLNSEAHDNKIQQVENSLLQVLHLNRNNVSQAFCQDWGDCLSSSDSLASLFRAISCTPLPLRDPRHT